MATLLKTVFVSCLLLLILLEECKPVLAKNQKLKAMVKELERRIKAMEECQACSKIKELNETINKLQEKEPAPEPVECTTYQTIQSDGRKTTDGDNTGCDKSLGPAWFRFVGNGGTKIPSSCISRYHCGTHAPGWINGAHPTVGEGQVTRQVCFSWETCCQWSINIQVRNCGDFFVYFIDGTARDHQCHLGYCTTD